MRLIVFRAESMSAFPTAEQVYDVFFGFAATLFRMVWTAVNAIGSFVVSSPEAVVVSTASIVALVVVMKIGASDD